MAMIEMTITRIQSEISVDLPKFITGEQNHFKCDLTPS